ncbi:IPT/TIG domain-containing protein [Streptomyces sp. NPDC048718]|uniref:IPT/TIG domain-containing protein n=1 Tax=Streptomyces sp. NPDC048718 TaxID=3365587 RepID=UPI0037100A11
MNDSHTRKITGLDPTNGPTGGNTKVALTGKSLQDVREVAFVPEQEPDLYYIQGVPDPSESKVSFKTRACQSGKMNVVVLDKRGAKIPCNFNFTFTEDSLDG